MRTASGSAGQLLETTAWAGLVLVFAYFLSGGAWVLAGAILAALLLLIGTLYAPQGMSILWLLGMPSLFVVIDGQIKRGGIPVLTADRALVGALVMAMLLGLVLRRRSLPRLAMIERWMLLMLGVVMLSFASTLSRKSGHDLYQGVVLFIEAYVTPYAGYLLARSQVWGDRDIRRLLIGLAWLAVYLAVVGAAQYFFGFLYLSPTYLGVGLDTDRAASGFGSPVEFGHVMVCLTLLCLLLHTCTRDAGSRALVLLAAVAAVAGVALSLTRACWLGAVLALAYVFWRDRSVRRVLVSGALLAGLGLAIALPMVMRTQVFEQRLTELTPIYNRLALWTTAANMVVHNPLLGVGFGYRTFNDQKREYLVSFGPAALGKYALEPGVPHNEFLHVLAMMGVPGFVVYAMVYVSAWQLTRRWIARGAIGPPGTSRLRPRLAVYVQGMLVVLGVAGMVSELWTFRYLLAMAFFMLGILASSEPAAEPAARPPLTGSDRRP